MEKTKRLEVRLPLSGSMSDQLDQIDDALKRTGVNPNELLMSTKLEIWHLLNLQQKHAKTEN